MIRAIAAVFALAAFCGAADAGIPSKAESLRVAAETGNPLHIVRKGQNEKPVLAIRNSAQESVAAQGTLKVEGFRGETFDLPVDIALDAGETKELPVSARIAKGVWKIRGELKADDGSVAEVDTRFAVMDFHGATPKQPRGTFRLGIHWHFPRFTDDDRRLAAAAMVACGAKLTRADVANMASIQPWGPDSWEFARTDEYLEMLDKIGVALDAIIFKTPQWAMTPPSGGGDSAWNARAVRPPVAGTFGTFCERLAARYGTRIDYYEIGNEWDIRFGGTYDEAVDVQREAYLGLKKGCPDVCVIPNGWAAAGDIPRMDGKGRTHIHEYFLRNAKDFFDVHAIHCHGDFPKYVNSISRKLFPMRERTGASGKPWFANESALSSVWSERNAAIAVWKKILWAWAHGSVDYVWYNLRATGSDPKNAEHGYGLLTADFYPRDSYVAFAALSTVVGGATFKRKVLDGDGMYWFEFEKRGSLVLTAWLDAGEREISVKTDAERAVQIDMMGNRSMVPVAEGKAPFRISAEPCAIVFRHATFADVDESTLRSLASAGSQVVTIPPDDPGRAPDFILESPKQVHDFYEANPAETGRLWKGHKDNSAKVWLSKEARGLRVRVEVEDDEHCEAPEGAALSEGDSVEVAVADSSGKRQRRFLLAHTERSGTLTRYDALFAYDAASGFASKDLDNGIRFNLIVNDSDSDRRESAIGIGAEDFLSGNMASAPLVRFAKQGEKRK